MAAPTPLFVAFLHSESGFNELKSVKLEVEGGEAQEKTESPFKFNLTKAGNGVLSFEQEGGFPYSFQVDIKENADDFSITFSKDMVSPPLMATLVQSESPEGDGTRHNIIRFEVHDPKEYVVVTGFDYHSGMRYADLALPIFHDLFVDGKLESSTVITFFEFQTGNRTQWVKGQGAEVIKNREFKSGWCRMTTELQGGETVQEKPILAKSNPKYPGENAISITNVYDYIQEIGRLRKKSLHELHILSHSWLMGPLVFNTNEREDFQTDGPKEKLRDPLDHDARAHKDFKEANMPEEKFKEFQGAWTDDAFAKIWGCFAFSRWRRLINKVRVLKNDEDPVVLSKKQMDFLSTEEKNQTKASTMEMMDIHLYQKNYMFALADAINRPVFGAGPGMGAMYKIDGPFIRMLIPDFHPKNKSQRIHKKEIDFLVDVMEWKVDKDNYVKYESPNPNLLKKRL